jgi:hypothetical protein
MDYSLKPTNRFFCMYINVLQCVYSSMIANSLEKNRLSGLQVTTNRKARPQKEKKGLSQNES